MDEIKILIADDNLEILEKLEETLHKINTIKLLGVAKDGKEEYEMIKKLKPDLIFTDLEITEMTGIEVLEKLKEENFKKVPQVIFITGKPSTDFIKRAIKIGAIDIIYKPFKDEKIKEEVERYKNMLLEENVVQVENNKMIKSNSFLKKLIMKIINKFNNIINFKN